MSRMNRRVVMAVEAGALAAALMFCAADQFIAREQTPSAKTLQQELQQLFLLLREETAVLDEFVQQ